MHYEIEASIYSAAGQLSVAQRTSPFFTDCPVIGAHILRDRTPLKLDEKGMKKFEKDIKRLYEAHAIEIFEVEGGKRRSLREMMKNGKKPEPKTEVSPPAVIVPEPPKEEAKTEVMQPEATPATVDSAAPAERKGKKGRKE
jgi:hypothetical protein